MDDAKKLQQEQMISSYIGKLLRDNFGKGPEAVFVSIGGRFITIYLRNFFSQIDKVLQDQDQDQVISDIREMVMYTLSPKIKMYIEMVTENVISEFYYDWCLHNKTGIIVGIAQELFKNTEYFYETYEGKEELEDELVRLNGYVEKSPQKITSYQINPRTIVVIGENTLIKIEKEFIRKGYSQLLKTIKRDMEKAYLHNDINYSKILKREVVDVFADWDFDLDKSIFVIIINPKQKT